MAEQALEASAPPSQAEKPADTKPQAAPDPEPWKKIKHKIKVDGQEAELDYDEIVRRAQKATGAEKRMQEAAQYRKTLEQSWNASDPSHFFKAKNLNPEEWAEQLLLEKMKREAMTPAEKKAFEKEQADKADRSKKDQELEELRANQKQLITQQVVAKLDGEIVDAFKAIDMKPNPLIVKRMAEIMDMHMDAHDGEMMPAKQALEQALGYRKTDSEEYLQSLTAEQLRTLLPKKLLDELRRQDVELVRSQSPMRSKESKGTSQPSTPKAQKRLSTEEFFKAMEAKLSG
jgi:hypothetical protein